MLREVPGPSPEEMGEVSGETGKDQDSPERTEGETTLEALKKERDEILARQQTLEDLVVKIRQEVAEGDREFTREPKTALSPREQVDAMEERLAKDPLREAESTFRQEIEPVLEILNRQLKRVEGQIADLSKNVEAQGYQDGEEPEELAA